MADNYAPATKYTHTKRKVFDKHVDRMETKRLRDREDHRSDMTVLGNRLSNLEVLFEKIYNLEKNKHNCEDSTCKFCSESWDYHTGTEGLE